MQTTHVAKEAATMPHDSPLPRVYSLGSDEGKLKHEGSKRQKTNEEQLAEEEKELLEEELQKLMMIVLVEKVYVEFLQLGKFTSLHKIHREHGWAYLAYKKCGRIAKEADVGMKLWNYTVHIRITSTGVGIRYKVIIHIIDDIGSTSLLLFDDLGVGGDVQTPLLKCGSSSKFSSSDVVPFSIEDTPKSKGVASSEGESSSSGSGKRTIINLDDYNEEEEQAKKGKK
ncbi:hypothetical protein Tco_0213653 [Tanacetum coccineum]